MLADHDRLNFQGDGIIVIIVDYDIDYARDYENRKSQSGYVFKLANAAISWATQS